MTSVNRTAQSPDQVGKSCNNSSFEFFYDPEVNEGSYDELESVLGDSTTNIDEMGSILTEATGKRNNTMSIQVAKSFESPSPKKSHTRKPMVHWSNQNEQIIIQLSPKVAKDSNSCGRVIRNGHKETLSKRSSPSVKKQIKSPDFKKKADTAKERKPPIPNTSTLATARNGEKMFSCVTEPKEEVKIDDKWKNRKLTVPRTPKLATFSKYGERQYSISSSSNEEIDMIDITSTANSRSGEYSASSASRRRPTMSEYKDRMIETGELRNLSISRSESTERKLTIPKEPQLKTREKYGARCYSTVSGSSPLRDADSEYSAWTENKAKIVSKGHLRKNSPSVTPLKLTVPAPFKLSTPSPQKKSNDEKFVPNSESKCTIKLRGRSSSPFQPQTTKNAEENQASSQIKPRSLPSYLRGRSYSPSKENSTVTFRAKSTPRQSKVGTRAKSTSSHSKVGRLPDSSKPCTPIRSTQLSSPKNIKLVASPGQFKARKMPDFSKPFIPVKESMSKKPNKPILLVINSQHFKARNMPDFSKPFTPKKKMSNKSNDTSVGSRTDDVTILETNTKEEIQNEEIASVDNENKSKQRTDDCESNANDNDFQEDNTNEQDSSDAKKVTSYEGLNDEVFDVPMDDDIAELGCSASEVTSHNANVIDLDGSEMNALEIKEPRTNDIRKSFFLTIDSDVNNNEVFDVPMDDDIAELGCSAPEVTSHDANVIDLDGSEMNALEIKERGTNDTRKSFFLTIDSDVNNEEVFDVPMDDDVTELGCSAPEVTSHDANVIDLDGSEMNALEIKERGTNDTRKSLFITIDADVNPLQDDSNNDSIETTSNDYLINGQAGNSSHTGKTIACEKDPLVLVMERLNKSLDKFKEYELKKQNSNISTIMFSNNSLGTTPQSIGETMNNSRPLPSSNKTERDFDDNDHTGWKDSTELQTEPSTLSITPDLALDADSIKTYQNDEEKSSSYYLSSVTTETDSLAVVPEPPEDFDSSSKINNSPQPSNNLVLFTHHALEQQTEQLIPCETDVSELTKDVDEALLSKRNQSTTHKNINAVASFFNTQSFLYNFCCVPSSDVSPKNIYIPVKKSSRKKQ